MANQSQSGEEDDDFKFMLEDMRKVQAKKEAHEQKNEKFVEMENLLKRRTFDDLNNQGTNQNADEEDFSEDANDSSEDLEVY